MDAPCPPDVLAAIGDLELAARIVVEGLVSGLHRSPFHGYSAEFSQYRHYRPGDDLKYVDWKLAARTDRIYTKQFRETTNTAAALVVDASASMDFPSAADCRRTRALSKFRYALIAAAALSHVIGGQGDAVALFAADRFVPPRAGRAHVRRVLAALSALEPRGTWRAAETIRTAADRLAGRALLVVLSDFYDDDDAVFAELRRASRMGHDVALLQVLSREEIEFPYRSDLEFDDLESGARVALDPSVARREYTDGVAAFLELMRSRAVAGGFQYSLIVTDTPPGRALRRFLLSRQS